MEGPPVRDRIPGFLVDPSQPLSIPKYADPLPIPPVLTALRRTRIGRFFRVAMRPALQQLHRDFPPTPVWGYEGRFPGPTIEARSFDPIVVEYLNQLPLDHLLPVDRTVHGARGTPEVRNVVHLHGGHVSPIADGHPEAWFTPLMGQTGPTFVTNVYEYPNLQQAATLMYHDHALGITRLNVYAGLIAFYLLRDDLEDSLNLPRGRVDVPLLIQDRSFNRDGTLFYPRQPDPPVPAVDPSVVEEFFAATNVVNGKVWPFLDVEPRKYRFRLANGANSRFYRLRLSSGQPFIQIATDQGLLPAPVAVPEITLAVAERADVIIDFSGMAGAQVLLLNDAPAPFPNGGPPDPRTVGQVMQFRVSLPLSQPDTSTVPPVLRPIEFLDPAAAAVTRDLTLVSETDRFGRPLLLLTGRRWDDPISETPRLGTTEVWRLINVTGDSHPIHLHLVMFQVLYRQPFDLAEFRQSGRMVFTGPPVPPPPHERGWKDTVRADPGEVTAIIAAFGPFAGEYPWHCHILEHEDHEMMRPYRVIP